MPVLVVSFVALLWLLEGCRPVTAADGRHWTRQARAAFAIGWWFGFGHFLAGLYWISFSFLVDANTFAWMIPFALFGITGVLAVYTGLAVMIAHLAAPQMLPRILIFSAVWVGFEWIRGWAFTGFPWNLTGTSWAASEPLMQVAAVAGVHGLSLLTVLVAAAPAILAANEWSLRFRWLMLGCAVGLLGAAWLAGAVRLAGADNDVVDGVRLRLVQPNIAQKEKWLPQLRDRHLQTLYRLSRQPADDASPTHVIWPETATPLFLSQNASVLAAVAAVVPPGGALITGAPRAQRTGNRFSGPWNSVHVIDAEARILATYDKSHLVPFGEYVPFRKYIGFAKITAGRGDFLPGPGPVQLAVPGLPSVSPLVCYEAIFPDRTMPHSSVLQARPGWLLNLTNDAWFGASSGPYQHLATSRFRAVEQGIPLVRVANTGISAIVDGYGRVLAQTRLNEQTVIDVELPKSLKQPTLFAQFGDWLVLIVALLLIGFSTAIRLKSSRNNPN